MREKLRQNVVYDAIVFDALMPGEQSKTLAFHARQLGIPVVMISGCPEKLEFAMTHGLQMLQKPFLYEELADALTQALDSGEAGQRANSRTLTMVHKPCPQCGSLYEFLLVKFTPKDKGHRDCNVRLSTSRVGQHLDTDISADKACTLAATAEAELRLVNVAS